MSISNSQTHCQEDIGEGLINTFYFFPVALGNEEMPSIWDITPRNLSS